MKAVILAGGFGTRISEETAIKPKPMVEIGDMPILWHIMKCYSHFGIQDFVICVGYKSYAIKEFFSNYALRSSSVRFDMASNQMSILDEVAEPWTVTIVETGHDTMTGGRLKRVREYLDNETFCVTYGDGVSDVNVAELVSLHLKTEATVTLTAVQPPGRFGAIALKAEQTRVSRFHEKPEGDGAWVSGGFFVAEPKVFDYIDGDESVFEHEPLQRIALAGELSAFRHSGFWQPMDTLRDKNYLESLWESGHPPWRIW